MGQGLLVIFFWLFYKVKLKDFFAFILSGRAIEKVVQSDPRENEEWSMDLYYSDYMNIDVLLTWFAVFLSSKDANLM